MTSMDNPPLHCHAFSNDALGTSDTVELAQRLRRRDVSPEELTEAAIKRATSVNERLNALEAHSFDKPYTFPLDKDKTFSGIPTFIKDNLPVAGFPTSFSSAAVFPKKEKYNDPYTKQFLKLGLNVLGKTCLPEFGLNASTEPTHKPATVNPWNIQHSCGASSGGAAALVAAGVVPIAHGNDGGGSIRIPAACCGLVGLKPSRGRHINSLAARALPLNILSEGVLTRSVRDTAMFHFEAEKIYRNKKLPAIVLSNSLNSSFSARSNNATNSTHNKNRLKIGLVLDSVTGVDTDNETRDTVVKTATLLQSLGHDVKEIALPISQQFSEDFTHYWAMMAFAIKATGKLAFNRKFDPKKLDDLTHGLASYYRQRMLQTPQVFYRLHKQARQALDVFENLDVILLPTVGRTPPVLGYLSPTVPFEELFERLRAYVGFTPMANVTGSPAISLPGGISSDNTPIGIQLVANLGREDLLIDLAYELEAHQPWQQLYEI
jgi:amidase